MASNGPPPEGLRIAVFAKAPVAGTVKTRLVPLLGHERAARLHARLVHHALATASAAGASEVQLWCAPDAADAFFAECARTHGVVLKQQEGHDLGARMAHAFEALLADGRPAILVGSDAPALTAAAMSAAGRALATHGAVFTPAEDGGYALVGLAHPAPSLFSGVAWGSATVMAETRVRLAAAGLRWHEAPRTWDVDRPEDYERLVREGLLPEGVS
jgi:rSAM/selenodomain-associated transferase 1